MEHWRLRLLRMKLRRAPRLQLAFIALSAFPLLAIPSAARGGVVRFVGGESGLTAGEGPESRFPLAFPGSGGHSARSNSSFAGETRVLYDLRDGASRASFDVSQDSSGDTDCSFTLTFTTASQLQFRFYAEPRPYSFSARFDDVVADAFYNADGDGPSDVYRGSLVHIDGVTE